jgi:hypothetical protein
MLRSAWLRVFLSLAFTALIVVSCGSRTSLPAPEPSANGETGVESGGGEGGDTSADVSHEAEGDAPKDGPLIEGGPIDVAIDCDSGPTCNPDDPGFVYQCGVRVFQCSSLETCKNGKCVNPCLDTLGQDTSNGCEFYAMQMDTVPEGEGACFAVFLVNQWSTGEPAKIEVSRNGTVLPVETFTRTPVGTGVNLQYAPYSQTQGLAKDQIAVIFLSRDPAALNDPSQIAPRRLASCPPGVTPAVVGDAAIHGTGRGHAFRIKTNVPVVAYQMLPYGAGRARITGATLLLPTNVWETNYVAANAYAKPPSIVESRAGPTMAILGMEDQTQVRILPTTAIVAGGGLAGTPANVATTYTLGRGEYLQFTQDQELTGSAISSTSPIAVIGGSTLMDIPLDRIRADGAQQMLPPVRALGSEYVGVRYRGRRDLHHGGLEFEAVPWRIVGVANGTQLTYDPPQAGAPAVVNARQMVEWNATGPFVVRSQDAAHPFYMAQYMTGSQVSGNTAADPNYDGEGDPEFVNVVPPKQYLPRYTFFTDPTYPETDLVVVRQRVATEAGLAFPDVSLDCAGTLGGWTTIGSGTYQFTHVTMSTGDFQGASGCNNGVHTIVGTVGGAQTTGPAFGVTVWGWGNGITWVPDDLNGDEANPKFTRWVSYGYPAGANVGRLNDVVLSAQ